MAQNLNSRKNFRAAKQARKLREITEKLKEEIRARQAAQKAVVTSETRYRWLFDNIPMGIALCRVLLDDEGNFIDNEYLDVNLSGRKYHGKNLAGMRTKDVFPDISDEIREEFAKVALTGHPLTKEVYSQKLNEWGRMWAYSLGNRQFVVITQKITEQKKYEEELVRLERLNLVGELAAGIGHEIRNPLTTVRGYLQMFQRNDQFKEYHNQLNTIIEELDRANDIITDFLSLAKNKHVQLKPGNINDTIRALYPLLKAEAFLSGHEVQTDIGDIPRICYDDKEIRQLILNLVRNGFEAMDSGGTLTIKTYYYNNKVILDIQDKGPGIPKEVLDKLGTPFVTTKENGTGLGLSVCYRIAERNNANIEVNSSLKGTTLSVIFKALETIE
ncbi:MAG: kinE 1 [Firmicutes bacterium]|nr:kinE 1 [Bacillota bacterium]